MCKIGVLKLQKCLIYFYCLIYKKSKKNKWVEKLKKKEKIDKENADG